MLEFLKFLRSLSLAIANYIYLNYVNKLRSYYSKLATKIIKNQQAFIIWPLSFAFILSYPSIYSILTTSQSLENSYIIDLHSLKNTSIDHPFNHEISLKQIWVIPNGEYENNENNYQTFSDLGSGALDKEFLLQVLDFQNSLLDGILNESTAVSVHSPLQFWNYDHDLLSKDQNILKTINKNTVKSSSGSEIFHSSLFSGVVKVNGLIRSADSLRILILYESSEKYGDIWDKNLSELTDSNTNGFQILLNLNNNDEEHNSFILNLTKLSIFDHILPSICYSLILIYCIISLANLKAVRSRAGLFIAYITQSFLSIMSSATITTYLFQGVDFYQIPLQLLPFVVVVVGIENSFRLISTISKSPPELSIPYKISKALTDCGLTSSLIVLANLSLLRVIYCFVGRDTQQFLIFASIALIVDHILHLTYFTSILSIDIHRLELKDLIQENDSGFNHKKSWFKTFNDKYSLDDNKISSNHLTALLFKLRKLIKEIRLPFSTTVTGTTVSVFFLIGLNIRWTNDSLRIPYFTSTQTQFQSELDVQHLKELDNLLDKRTFSNEVIEILGTSENLQKVGLFLFQPSIAYANGLSVSSLPSEFTSNVSYRFDFFYVLEFLTLLMFILSISLISLRYFTANITAEYEEKNLRRILEKENTFQTKVLSGGHALDIIKTSTSNSPFIVSIGLDHRILVWSPVSQPMPQPTQLPISNHLWPITHFVLSDRGNFIVVFSKTGIVKCFSRLSMTWIWKFEIPELKGTAPLEAFFRIKTIPAFLQRKRANDLLKKSSKPSSRRNSMRSVTSVQMKSNNAFGNNSNVTSDLEEFIIVLKVGTVITISCEEKSIMREKLSNSPLVSSVKLITPRVNDRLISCSQDGNILVSTAVNNKWKSRVVHVIENMFNNPAIPPSPNFRVALSNIAQSPQIISNELKPDFDRSAIAIVPFVGFIVRTYSFFAELIDVQTGILIKRFSILSFKRGTFKVFHDQPTHCRFCGSASIESFSVVYTLADKNTIHLHTFKPDHRAKTSICLRVERDPREIRCVGFNQVSESNYELDNIEGWCSTDKNEIMGIRRKSEEQIAECVEKVRSSGLRRRHANGRHFNDEHAPKLFNLWEGWTMTANGKVDIYEIPDVGNAEGLLVNSVGQINKFGHKSIVVVFGNIMKILYLGNDELIYREEQGGGEISGLSFVNKRRKSLKKVEHHSTNFSEANSIPGLSELAL